MRPRRLLCLSGPAAMLLAWTVIGVSWSLNPWFRFTRDAFSDLGGEEACCSWLYNYGLIATGLLLMAYGACLYISAHSKLGAAGASHLFLAGVFLALIGVFPAGTRPHTFVSSWFFLQTYAAYTVLGIALWGEGSWVGKPVVALSLMALPVAVLVELVVGWPSAAVLEAYGIAVIDAYTALTAIHVLGGVDGERGGAC